VTECALIEIRVHLDEEKSSIFLFENDSPVREREREKDLKEREPRREREREREREPERVGGRMWCLVGPLAATLGCVAAVGAFHTPRAVAPLKLVFHLFSTKLQPTDWSSVHGSGPAALPPTIFSPAAAVN
jgi:hypothetical protein